LPSGVHDVYGEPYRWGETPLEEQCREAFERAYNAPWQGDN
jgi:hypothetical protein